jgi:hypothetical protein
VPIFKAAEQPADTGLYMNQVFCARFALKTASRRTRMESGLCCVMVTRPALCMTQHAGYLFVCGLFNDVISSSDYVESNVWMISE